MKRIVHGKTLAGVGVAGVAAAALDPTAASAPHSAPGSSQRLYLSAPTIRSLLIQRRHCSAVIPQDSKSEEKAAVNPNPDRPASIAEAGDGPVPLDFKPGAGTDIIDHHMEVQERFYKPVTTVPLEELLEHEKKREHLTIYRTNQAAADIQKWEGGIPRFVRAPMHMLKTRGDSRNSELPPGPVLHDTRTGIAIRILGSMLPSPEMVVKEEAMRNSASINFGRYMLYGWLFVVAFLLKFTSYMALRTKLRSQGIANPILPHNRIKVLEILYFARADFKQYKALFNEFRTTCWLPYRQAQLQEEANMQDKAAASVIKQAMERAEETEKKSVWQSIKGAIGLGPKEEVQENPVKKVFIPELGESFEIDTSRIIIGMSPTGPVYAPPDAELLTPDMLQKRMKQLQSKVVARMDDENKQWSAESYDKRARDQANEFIVQFHMFLSQRDCIKPMDPAKLDSMYELPSVPRIQDLQNLDPSATGASEGLAVRPQLVRVK